MPLLGLKKAVLYGTDVPIIDVEPLGYSKYGE